MSETPIATMYCDGGCIGANPSSWGCTWAWLQTDADGNVLRKASGVLPADVIWKDGDYPPDKGPTYCTNNVAEMAAMLKGLQALPAGWCGTIYCDSNNTLGRIFRGEKWKNVPGWMVSAALRLRERIDFAGCKARYVLLSGHPTIAEMKAGRSKEGRPVSRHNIMCDEMCTAAGLAWLVEQGLADLSEIAENTTL